MKLTHKLVKELSRSYYDFLMRWNKSEPSFSGVHHITFYSVRDEVHFESASDRLMNLIGTYPIRLSRFTLAELQNAIYNCGVQSKIKEINECGYLVTKSRDNVRAELALLRKTIEQYKTRLFPLEEVLGYEVRLGDRILRLALGNSNPARIEELLTKDLRKLADGGLLLREEWIVRLIRKIRSQCSVNGGGAVVSTLNT